MKEPALYRTPKAPGYLGRYNWRSTLMGAFILLIANSTATQFIAKKFAYQPALGTAILSFKTGKAFAWIAWGWKNCTSHDNRVRRPLIEGEMIALVGSFLAVLGSVASTSRRARKLSEGSDDLHGSARLATRDDIEQIGLLDATQGVYIGGWFDEKTSHVHYLRHNGPEHILAFAPTRSGKGVSLVIPTLLAWEESAMIYDIKGENWAKTSGFRQQQGHICLKFSPVETNSGSRFNPLAEIRLYTLRDVSDAQNIAEIIVRTGEDSPQERYWQDAAVSVTTGLIIHVCYEAALEGRRACLADLSHTFTRPGQSFRNTLKEILNYQHDPDLAQDWRMPDGTRTPTHPAVKEKAQEMLDKEDKDFSGVLSTAKTALALFSDVVQIRGAQTGSIEQRVPIPMVMWNPFQEGSHRLRFESAPLSEIGCYRITPLICYETAIPWPVLTAQVASADLVVAAANTHWADGTNIAAWQYAAVEAWARLFRMAAMWSSNASR